MRNNYFIKGDVVFIELNRRNKINEYCKISIDSLEELLKLDVKWCVSTHKKVKYATCTLKEEGKKRTLHLHRFIMNPKDGLVVNHINGDGLDNTLNNLEVVTIQVNGIKRINVSSNNTSGFTGISYNSKLNKWTVAFKKDGKEYFFGRYLSKEKAIEVAKEKRKELYNELLK